MGRPVSHDGGYEMQRCWAGLLCLGTMSCGVATTDTTTNGSDPGLTSATPASGSGGDTDAGGGSSEPADPPGEATSGGTEPGSSGGETPSSGPAFDLGSPQTGGEGEGACQSDGPLPPLLGEDIGRLAAPFDELYVAHDLGPVAGVPGPMGGTIVSLEDPDVLVVVGAAERVEGALYEVPVDRDNCGHITGFGLATKMADVPHADANLVHAPGGLLVSQYPIAQLTQLRGSGAATTDLGTLGVAGPFSPSTLGSESPGGLGLVPAWIGAANEYRVVAYPTGQWYRLQHSVVAGAIEFSLATPSVILENGPGAFAYVPPDSPGFDQASIIVAEWFDGAYVPEQGSAIPANSGDPQRVGVYEVDDDGDPIVGSRRDFFEQITAPWGAYFDPISGDFLFLSWAQEPDRITQVRGFAPPPAG